MVRETMIIAMTGTSDDMNNNETGYNNDTSSTPMVEEYNDNEQGTVSSSNRRRANSRGQTSSKCHNNGTKSGKKSKRHYDDNMDYSMSKKMRGTQSESSARSGSRGKSHKSGGYRTNYQGPVLHNTPSNGSRGKQSSANPSIDNDSELDKLTEDTYVTYTISGTPQQMEELSKMDPSRKIRLSMTNDCVHLESTTSQSMFDRFDKTKNGNGISDDVFTIKNTDQTYSKGSKNKPVDEPVTLEDKDIVRKVTAVKGSSTFPHSIDFDFPNIIVPGHLSGKSSKLGSGNSGDSSSFKSQLNGNSEQKQKKDKDKTTGSNTETGNKNGLSLTLNPGETITNPREIANSNVNNGVINYLKKFASYTTTDSMSKGISYDVNGKVKINHTDEKPHPLVQYYKDRYKSTVNSNSNNPASSTTNGQSSANTRGQTSSKSGKGKSRYTSSTSNKGPRDAATESNIDESKYGPGVTQSKDHPDFVLMDKSLAKKTLKEMSNHPTVLNKIDALSNIAEPTAYITPRWNKGNAQRLIEMEQQKKVMSANGTENGKSTDSSSKSSKNTLQEFGNTKSSANKNTSGKGNEIMSFKSLSGFGGNRGGTLTDTDKFGMKGKTDQSWLSLDTKDKNDSANKDQQYNATVTLLIRSVPAKSIQGLNKRNT
jgi:hypothetical protein